MGERVYADELEQEQYRHQQTEGRCESKFAALAARLAAAEEQVKDLRESGARQHMGMARRDAEMETLRERERRLREALHDAWTDIGQWLQLARYQREQLDHDKTPCPSQDGIDRSEATRKAISAALADAGPGEVERG